RSDDEECGSDGLYTTSREQHGESRRQPTDERGSGEENGAPGEGRVRPSAYDRRAGNRDDGEHEVERREDPGDRRYADVEAAQDSRERERHDRGVGESEPDGNREQACPESVPHAVSRKRAASTSIKATAARGSAARAETSCSREMARHRTLPTA